MILEETRTIKINPYKLNYSQLNKETESNIPLTICCHSDIIESDIDKGISFNLLVEAAQFNDKLIDCEIYQHLQNENFNSKFCEDAYTFLLNQEISSSIKLKVIIYLSSSLSLLKNIVQINKKRNNILLDNIIEHIFDKDIPKTIISKWITVFQIAEDAQELAIKTFKKLKQNNNYDKNTCELLEMLESSGCLKLEEPDFFIYQLIIYLLEVDKLTFEAIVRIIDTCYNSLDKINNSYRRIVSIIIRFFIKRDYINVLKLLFTYDKIYTIKTIDMIKYEVSNCNNINNINLLIHEEIIRDNTRYMFVYSYLEHCFEFISDNNNFLSLYNALKIIRKISGIESQIESLIELKLIELLNIEVGETLCEEMYNTVNFINKDFRKEGIDYKIKKEHFEKLFTSNLFKVFNNKTIKIQSDNNKLTYESSVLVI